MARVVRDLRAEQVDQGPPGFVKRSRLGDGQQGQGIPERARRRLGPRRRERALGPPGRVGRQRRGRFEEARGCRQPAVGDRAIRRAFEFGRDILVRAHRGTGAVPGAAVRIEVRVGGVSQRLVNLPPLRRGRRTVDGRTNERMPEPGPVAELDQARRLGGGRRVGTDAQPLRGAPEQRHVPDRFGGHDQQELPGRRRQGAQLANEALLQAGGQGPGAVPPGIGAEGQLGRCQRPRQLQQGQRIAVGLGQDAVPYPGIERAGHGRIQQHGRVVDGQTAHPELGQPGQFGLLVGLADGEDQAHRFRGEPSRHELQGLGRGLVQPLRVVHDADQGPLLGHLVQQGQHGQAQQEAVGCGARLQSEHRAQGRPLRGWQLVHVVQVGAAQLVQPRVGELELRLDTRRPAHPAFPDPVHQEVEQSGLAYPGLTA
jgi:hypothetical protein